MSNPLTIQLPPNLEQQMLHEAQKQNTSLEHLVLGLIEKHYDVRSTNISSLEDFFNAIRTAIQTGHPTVHVPVNDFYLQTAESLQRTGVLTDFQVKEQHLILHVNPHPPKHPLADMSLDLDPSVVGSELAEIAKKLKHDDPDTRVQAIHDLAAWHEQQA
jgi:ribosomal protein S8